MFSCLVRILVALTTSLSQQTRPADLAVVLPGRVLHADVPVPGATVTAIKGDRTRTATSGEDGMFRFADLEPGVWILKVEMRGFVTVTREVTVPPSGPELIVTLTMRSYADMIGEGAVKASWPAAPGLKNAGAAPSPAAQADANANSDPEILNGSVTNGAATRFAQPRAAGNNRPRGPSLYSGALTGNFGNSAWNAHPYSFGGSATPSPDFADAQLGITFGGPFHIPFTKIWGPQMRVTYNHGVQHTASTRSALVPTLDERRGNLSTRPGVIRDPQTGLPFDNNTIPVDRIVPQAGALLAFYPMPTGATATGANFQRALLSTSTSDRLQVDASKNFGVRTQLAGSLGVQRTLSDSVSVFDFSDRSRASSLTASLNWNRRMTTRLNVRANYQFSRTENETTPYFSNRANVSGDAGIAGNAQDPLNWGPPTIAFPDFVDLTDARYQRTSRHSHAFGGQVLWRRGDHNLTFGADARLNVINQFTQPDPRGTLSFTGATTGDAFADFLLGIPATSSIAFGNIDTHIRGGQLDAYFDDDWRLAPGFTLDLGIRWEYETPYSERDGRLANLDVLSGFTAIAPVTGADPSGALSGTRYPSSLIRRDPFGFEPRVGVSWRPILTSSLVIKAGYGLYRNLGVYQSIGTSLAQQPPFSEAYSIANTPATPLTLAQPFPASLPSRTTFAIDPGFRTALLHSWNVTVQRDLPGSLTIVGAYFLDRGLQLAQAFLPNTYAPGAVNPCPTCPAGFTFLTSGGDSIRNAGQLIVRRRLYAGFTASVTYTVAKSTDNAATFSNTNVSPGSLSVAQNWTDLEGERGPSSFDQRHLVSVEAQYTTGVGIIGGTLVDNFWGRLYKDWTLTAQLNAGSGLPVTPIVFVPVPGTGVIGVRPSLTGQPIDAQQEGSYANPAAFTTPVPGTWGNAGRNAIRGPSTFSFDMSVTRTFRFNRRLNLDWRLSASNVLNRVTFTAIDRIITSPQFGRPTNTNQMRRILTNFTFRF